MRQGRDLEGGSCEWLRTLRGESRSRGPRLARRQDRKVLRCDGRGMWDLYCR
jgi:hypothetical protein